MVSGPPSPAPPQLRAAAPLAAWSQVSIVGLGLIGGSLACALRRQLPQLRLIGIDRSAQLSPLLSGVVDVALAADDTAGVEAAFAGSELICVATPVGAIAEWL